MASRTLVWRAVPLAVSLVACTLAATSGELVCEPTRISKIIHQTAPVKFDVLTPVMQSWLDHNPCYEYRLYDDVGARTYVVDNFPEYLDVYDMMPTSVARGGVLRYLVLLKDGGVFPDADAACVRPLSFQPDDRLVVGVGADFTSPVDATNEGATGARNNQPLHPTIAAEAGHAVFRSLLKRFKVPTYSPPSLASSPRRSACKRPTTREPCPRTHLLARKLRSLEPFRLPRPLPSPCRHARAP